MPKVESNKNYKFASAGMQPGILIKIIDLGTQENEYKGDVKRNRQLFFQWELPEELIDAPESEYHGKPMTQGAFVNLTVGERAKLTKITLASTGEAPKVGFDPATLLGSSCNLHIAHSTKNDGSTKSEIENFAPLLKSQKLGKPTNVLTNFDLDNFDANAFENLPAGFKKIIEHSPEYRSLKGGVDHKQENTSPRTPDDLDDEIPF